MNAPLISLIAVFIIGSNCISATSNFPHENMFMRARRTSQGAFMVASRGASRQGSPRCWKGVEHGATCGGLTGPCQKFSSEKNKLIQCSCDIASLQYRCQ